jgi:hypothetical protein
MIDSTVDGYIPPVGVVEYDQELEDVFQGLIVGVTSLQGDLVRPRWQQDPPPMPAIGENWCAFGVKTIRSDDGPYFHQNAEDMDSVRHESIELTLSFYGNHGQSIANIFKDGLTIPQNIAQLRQKKSNISGAVKSSLRPIFLINSTFIAMT